MNVTKIPFVKSLNVQESDNDKNLYLDINNNMRNIYAGARLTLAETQSGLHLQKLFTELDGKILL